MAFTGRKVKGGRVLTEETVKNREQVFWSYETNW